MLENLRKILFYFLPDYVVIRLYFLWKFKRFPNLHNPQALNEKIQWLKLNDRTSLHTICADKVLVRDYVAEKIGSKYLIPLVLTSNNVDDINESNLPAFPVIIKSNHNSGDFVIVRDKTKVNYLKIQKSFKKSLKTNFYSYTKEWQYKNIKPMLIVEKLLLVNGSELPNDYKFHCFNGKIEMIQVDIDRGKVDHFRNWYTSEWVRAPFKWSSQYKGKYTDPAIYDLPKPLRFEKMISLAEALSKDFKYCRVDLYLIGSEIYFGEITFHHDGGFAPILPAKYDLILGQKLNLHV